MATTPICGKQCVQATERAGTEVQIADMERAEARMPQQGRVKCTKPISSTTITVTSFMMCSAFSLDSATPLMFSHQNTR